MLSTEQMEQLEQPYEKIGRKIELLLFTGRLLMENGANSNQIIRDITRAAAFMGIPAASINIHITYSTLMVNINDGDRSHISFHKSMKHGADMTVLSAVSKLAWQALEGNYSLDDYEGELRRIEAIAPHYPLWLQILSAGIACSGFCLLFGGDMWDALFTVISAALGFWVRELCIRSQFNIYMSIALAAFTATATAYGTHFFSQSPIPWYPMISGMLFIVPGIPLINAVDDLLNNYIVAGWSRTIHTVLIVGSMTGGIFAALRFFNALNIADMSIMPNQLYLVQFFAAAVAALGFSILFNTPVRLLPMIALGGIISVGLRNSMLVGGYMGLAGASFLGATAVSLIMLKVASHLRTSPPVLAIPAVIPLIPGVLLYRLLIGVLQINELDATGLLQAERSGVTALLTIIGIAMGVAIPYLFAQRFLDRDKARRVDALLRRRRGEL